MTENKPPYFVCIRDQKDRTIHEAVIDRFDGDYAVVLFGYDETKVDIPKKLLPSGAREGSWLSVSFKLDP